jgi:hypothetical protein
VSDESQRDPGATEEAPEAAMAPVFMPTPFESAVLDRLDRIIELLSAQPALLRTALRAKPNVTLQETVAMGKIYVRETNHDTGEVKNYVKTIG